jgi:tetratricopeptide (TPR) repeat protein
MTKSKLLRVRNRVMRNARQAVVRELNRLRAQRSPLRRAQSLFERGAFKKAEKVLLRSRNSPFEREILRKIYQIHLRLDHPSKLETGRALVQIEDPAHPILPSIAAQMNAAQLWDESEALLRQHIAATKMPMNDKVALLLADALRGQKKYGEADQTIRATEGWANDRISLIKLLQIEIEANDPARTETARLLLPHEDDSSSLLYKIALQLVAVAEYAEAAEILERHVASGKAGELAHLLLTNCLARLGNHERAVKVASETALRHTGDPLDELHLLFSSDAAAALFARLTAADHSIEEIVRDAPRSHCDWSHH